MTMRTGRYEFAKTTQRMVVLVNMVTSIRRSVLPYVYITKDEYEALGGVYPPRNEDGSWGDPDPKDAMVITVTRADVLG